MLNISNVSNCSSCLFHLDWLPVDIKQFNILFALRCLHAIIPGLFWPCLSFNEPRFWHFPINYLPLMALGFFFSTLSLIASPSDSWYFAIIPSLDLCIDTFLRIFFFVKNVIALKAQSQIMWLLVVKNNVMSHNQSLNQQIRKPRYNLRNKYCLKLNYVPVSLLLRRGSSVLLVYKKGAMHSSDWLRPMTSRTLLA